MTQKKILIIGAGSMAQPVILSLLKNLAPAPENFTLITGASAGKNKEAILQLLAENGLSPYHHCIFQKTLPTPSEPYKVVIYAAKPAQFEAIAKEYQSLVSPTAQIISIAAALTTQDFKNQWGEGISVIRTMPHVPRALYGIYADPATDISLATTAFADMGNAVILPDEQEAFQRFTVHASSGPAFLATFLDSLGDHESQTQAAAFFRDMTLTPASTRQEEIFHSCATFYHHWWVVAERDFGKEIAETLIPQTILGTLNYLESTKIPPLDFVKQVRSHKGVTHAGLLYMEGKIPGKESLRPEESITHALLAAMARLQAMKAHSAEELGGVDIARVNAEAEALQ